MVMMTSEQKLRNSFPYSTCIVVITWVQLNKSFERKSVNIFLSISLNMCFGCSKEPSLGDDSFEYPQHIFWLRNKKMKFELCTLIWRPDLEPSSLNNLIAPSDD